MSKKPNPPWNRSALAPFAAPPDSASAPVLAAYLEQLCGQMHWLAGLMEVRGGPAGEHAAELHGAADIAQGWADEIRAMFDSEK